MLYRELIARTLEGAQLYGPPIAKSSIAALFDANLARSRRTSATRARFER